MIDPSNNNYNNGMKDQFLGKMYQIVSMSDVRKDYSTITRAPEMHLNGHI